MKERIDACTDGVGLNEIYHQHVLLRKFHTLYKYVSLMEIFLP